MALQPQSHTSSSRSTRSSRSCTRSPNATSMVRILFAHELVDFTQDKTGVTARICLAEGTVTKARTDYLVGCDWAASTVRGRPGFVPKGESLLQIRQVLFLPRRPARLHPG
jgi:2-polyprenyl-6-methoxyphenol hydroxylase-like FAD-dependent oxidoreductase